MARTLEIPKPTPTDKVPPIVSFPNSLITWGPNLQIYELMEPVFIKTTTVFVVVFFSFLSLLANVAHAILAQCSFSQAHSLENLSKRIFGPQTQSLKV